MRAWLWERISLNEVGVGGGRKIREVWALVTMGAIWVGSWRRGLVGSNEDGGWGI